MLKGGDLVVAGYASVEVVDKQGDKITKQALKDAFKKYMEDPKFRNVQLAHSNIQVGEVIPSYTDNEGRFWKSEVDDVGMFVEVSLRDDIEKAKWSGIQESEEVGPRAWRLPRNQQVRTT